LRGGKVFARDSLSKVPISRALDVVSRVAILNKWIEPLGQIAIPAPLHRRRSSRSPGHLLVGPGSVHVAHTEGEYVEKGQLHEALELYCEVASKRAAGA